MNENLVTLLAKAGISKDTTRFVMFPQFADGYGLNTKVNQTSSTKYLLFRIENLSETQPLNIDVKKVSDALLMVHKSTKNVMRMDPSTDFRAI